MGLRDRLDKAQEKVKSFNDRENLFKQPLSDYEELTKVLQTFEPYHKLWDIAMEFDLDKQDWYIGPFLRLQFPPIEKKVG
jgi:dynein heavy chain